MSYSDKNTAFDKMKKGQYDDRIQWEATYATELLKAEPTLTRDEALRSAARAWEVVHG